MTDLDELFDVKGLAAGLKRSREYVSDMKSAGFFMPAGRASLRMAVQWLADHPKFSRKQAKAVRFSRRSQKVTPDNIAGVEG